MGLSHGKENIYEKYGKPTLDLVFTGAKKSLTDRVSNVAVEFTRTQDTQASYVKSDGIIGYAATDVARFDHDPVTGESLGLLIEESRRNFATRSDDFVTDSTNTNVVVIPNSAVAPDGKFTAVKIIDDSTNAEHYVQHPAVNGIVQTNSVHSIFAKAAELDTFELRTQNSNTIARFTLSGDGTATPISGVTSASIEKYPNGWYKCSYVANFLTTTTNPRIALYNGAQSYVGDGSGIYVWGLQFENQVTFGTSYIPTTPTFTSRASEATYYDQNGIVSTASTDVARDDAYFPDENGVFKPAGLLLEPAGSNTQKYSVTFADWTRSPTASRVLNNSTSPDGTLTATKMVEGVGSQRQHINLTFNSTGNYTHSVFAKAAERQYLYMFPYSTGGNLYHFGVFDLVNGTSYSTSSDFYHKIISLSNGWYRCVFRSYNGGFGDFEVGISPSANPADLAALDYQGDGSSGLYIWGMQTELNLVETSYIPTSGIATTRAADISSSSTSLRGADTASITGAGFSSFYNQSEGTIYCSVISRAPLGGGNSTSNTGQSFNFTNASGTNALVGYRGVEGALQGNWFGAYVVSQGTTVFNSTVTNGWLQNVPCNHALAYQINNHRAAAGGVLTSAGSGNAPTDIDRVYFGQGPNTGNYNRIKAGTFARLTYWPTRLPDSDLQSLTE